MAYGELTTLDDVKAWLKTGQGAFPASDDALLARLITAASRFIESWLGRRIALTDWQEVRDGTGGQRLALANVPVTEVLSLSLDGLAIPPADPDGSFSAGYVFTPTELALRGYVFTRRPQNVVVTYTAGYAATPPDIAQACIELVCRRYKERARIGEVSRAIGGSETVTYARHDMSDDLRRLLSQYRAVTPVSGFARRLAGSATDPTLVAAVL